MKYTAPTILTEVCAGAAIQSGTDDSNKGGVVLDNAPIRMLSATAAYEADE